MLVQLDILDDRLEAGDGSCREGLRDYLAHWRDGDIAPLSEAGVVLIVATGDGERPIVANDGLGEGTRVSP